MSAFHRAKLFLSHSSDDTDVAQRLAAALAASFDVFLDASDLVLGDDWQLKVEAALLECDVGLVVLSKAVLQRPFWVSNEAFVLALRRRHLHPTLLIVPVLLADFEPAWLQHPALAPARLDALQAVRLDALSVDMAPFVARLQSALDVDPDRLPMARVELELASLLRQLDRNALELLADDLGLPRAELQNTRDPRRWLAARLLRSPFEKLEAAHQGLLAIAPSDAPRLFRRVAPYCWVHRPSAARLAQEALKAPPRAPLSMNANRQETLRLHIWRASSSLKGWRTLDCDGAFDDGSDVAAMLAKNIRQSLLTWAGYSPGDEPSDAELMAELQALLPIFVLLPPWFASIDAGVLEALRTRFPALAFLLWTQQAERDLTVKFKDMVVLPGLELTQENGVYRRYKRCLAPEDYVMPEVSK